MRVESKLGAEHVVDILRVHLGSEVAEAIDEATLGVQVVVGDMEDCAPYHFCIVMPMAEKCLQMPLLHDRFAGVSSSTRTSRTLPINSSIEHYGAVPTTGCEVRHLCPIDPIYEGVLRQLRGPIVLLVIPALEAPRLRTRV